MQKSFSFKGLAHNGDNLLANEGECMELVNLRYRDGCLLPIPSVFKEKEMESVYTKIYWHSVAGKYLAIESSDEQAVHFYDKDFNIIKSGDDEDSLVLFPQLKGVERIEFLGNMVCCVAYSTIYYLIYDTDIYRWLGERPQLPDITFSLKSIVYSVITDAIYLTAPPADAASESLYWGNVSKGYFDECLSGLHSKGYYVDRALLRFALRLFDGSYLYYSPVYYVDDDNSEGGLARDSKNFTSNTFDTANHPSPSSCRFQVKIQGFIPTFHFANLNLSDWENIIVAIDVFTSGSIYGHKVSKTDEEWSFRNDFYYSGERGFEQYVSKSNKDILTDVSDATMFYKIAEFSISGVLLDSVKDVSPSSLALCHSLPDEDSSSVTRGAADSFVFNGRLHLAGIHEILFKAYNNYDYLPAMLEPHFADYAMVATKIETSNGLAIVKKEYEGTFALGLKDGVYCITPYIMYPDARATEITFVIQVADTIYRKSFLLKQHKVLNIASFVYSYGDGTVVTIEGTMSNGLSGSVMKAERIKAFFSYVPGRYEIVFSGENKRWYYGDRIFAYQVGEGDRASYISMISTLNPVDGDTLTVVLTKGDELENLLDIRDIALDSSWEVLDALPVVDEVNECEVRGNVLKVSAVDNPLCFPAKNTYSPSCEDIIAISSNTVALSQGQFGQHPLYLFCKDGIWAMTNDTSGNLVYATSHPISREVCMNASSLCGIDSGVVFVGKKGLMLLQGGRLNSISDALHCEGKHINDTTLDSIFVKIANLSYNGSILSGGRPLKEYVKNVAVGYMANEKELWVSNPKFDYTYVFSLENNSWTKVNRSFSFFINAYPNVMGNTWVDDKSYISVLHKDYTASYAPVLLITRPQLWGTKLPKRIMQFMLHASVKATTENAAYEYGGMGCYLLCSNDGVHFKLLAGEERTKDFNDIVFPFFPSQSYKYYVIALSGTMSLDSRIAGAELAIECVWNNRLR